MIREVERKAGNGLVVHRPLPARGLALGWGLVVATPRPERRAQRRVQPRLGVLGPGPDRLLRRAAQRGQGAAAVRQLRRHGEGRRACGGSTRSTRKQRDLAARPQLRDRQAQGERPRRQPDRDRRGRGVAGRGHRRGDVRGGRLRELRPRAERVGAARTCAIEYPVRRARRGPDVAAQPHGRDRRAAQGRDPGAAGQGRASR